MDYLTFTMIRLNLLLVFYFISFSEISGNTRRSVTGEGENVILSCDFEARDILAIDLIRFSKIILDCQNDECKSENSRLLKKGSCDIIIKDPIFSDAGKYNLDIYYYNDQRELERQTLQYHLHIHDEILVKTGENVKLDVLLINADKVQHQSRRSTEWTEVWTRGHGVKRYRLTVRDRKLIINDFTFSDSGTYRVLDSEGDTMITVTVTASNTGSEGKLDTDEDKTNAVEPWIIVLSVIGAQVVLVISAVIKCKCQKRNTEHEDVPMEEREQQNI